MQIRVVKPDAVEHHFHYNSTDTVLIDLDDFTEWMQDAMSIVDTLLFLDFLKQFITEQLEG